MTILQRPTTKLTGPAEQSFHYAIDIIQGHEWRDLWGTEPDGTIVYSDDHAGANSDPSKTTRCEISVLQRDELEEGMTIATGSDGHWNFYAEKIIWVNDDKTAFIGQDYEPESKYELIDEQWHRTEFTTDYGWADRRVLDEPIPVAVVTCPDRTYYDLGVGDEFYTYR